jgi:nucleoside-diphosphate-sugar epimerase
VRTAYDDANVKVNELLYRRIDIEDVVSAHLAAIARAAEIGFGRFIITSTTPFTPEDLVRLRSDVPAVVERYVPHYRELYRRLGWRMFPGIDRVYVNELARTQLGWQPRYDFRRAIDLIQAGEDPRSPLARAVGRKGYGEPGSIYEI